jgi:predicted MFS family arabinose efflux permease
MTGGEIGLGSALFHAVVMLASLRLDWVTRRLSHRGVLVLGALTLGQYPLLLGLASDARLFFVTSMLGGIVWAMAGAGLINRLMERIPTENRSGFLALHNVALNSGILIGSLAGPLVAELFGLREGMFVAFGLRLLAGILMALWA